MVLMLTDVVPVVVAILKLTVAVIPTILPMEDDKSKTPCEMGPIIAGNVTRCSMLMATGVGSYKMTDTLDDARRTLPKLVKKLTVQDMGRDMLVGADAVASVSESAPQGIPLKLPHVDD